MSKDSRKIQSALPTVPDRPGITSTDLSNFSSAFENLPEQEQSRLFILFERRDVMERTCENNRHQEEKGRQNLALMSLLSVVIIVLSAFAYSGMTKDKTLSEKVINTMLGVLGGGGAVAFIKKQG